jgi:hypothetical protein
VPHELRDQPRAFLRERASLVSIGVVFAMFHNLLGPMIRIQMTLRVGIPFDFSTESRGMPAKDLGNLLLRVPFP